MALSASSPRRIASSLSNSVTPRPLPVSRLTSISILAPSSPAGVSPDSTSERTMSIAASTLAGSLSNVATRAYISPPLVNRDSRQLTPSRAPHGIASVVPATLYLLRVSHPALAARCMLEYKGVEHRAVDSDPEAPRCAAWHPRRRGAVRRGPSRDPLGRDRRAAAPWPGPDGAAARVAAAAGGRVAATRRGAPRRRAS